MKQKKEIRSQEKLFTEPIDQYHMSGALGSTHIRTFIESKNKFIHLMNNPLGKTGAALDLGSALHCLVLEPQEFYKRYCISPEFDRRTKEGKENYEIFSHENEHKMILKKDQYDMAKTMCSNIMENKMANGLINGCSMEQCARVKLSNGLDIQCRPDAIKKDHIIDIKTCQSIKDFKWDIKKNRYDLQAAFYYFILKSIDQDSFYNACFYFIAVDKSDINEVKVFGIDNDTLNDIVERQIKPTLIELGIFLKEIEDIKTYKYEQTEIEWINI